MRRGVNDEERYRVKWFKKRVKASTYKDREGQYMVGRMSTNG